jgi:hypothetical protein
MPRSRLQSRLRVIPPMAHLYRSAHCRTVTVLAASVVLVLLAVSSRQVLVLVASGKGVSRTHELPLFLKGGLTTTSVWQDPEDQP